MVLATLCYIKKDNRYLMIHVRGKKNDQYNGKWNGVGGKLKKGETPEECAIREIKEETGLKATDPILCGILTFPEIFENKDWYVFVYLIENFEGFEHESKEGELAWFTKKEILKLNLWEGDYKFLPLIFKNKFFSGKFVYVDGKLKDFRIQTPNS